ncbi:MAG: response regulator [Acidimicrobiia bacterium]
MPKVVVASDAPWVSDQVKAALVSPGFEVIVVDRGQDVRDVVGKVHPDLVIVDLQIGNMGGMAVSIDLRLEESADRLPHVPVLLLLDREADRFLARSAQADAVLVKPFDPGTLRRVVKQLIAAEEARRSAEEEADEASEIEGDEPVEEPAPA